MVRNQGWATSRCCPSGAGPAPGYTSVNRRKRVEGTFGTIENDASQSLTRGRFRVMGLARTSRGRLPDRVTCRVADSRSVAVDAGPDAAGAGPAAIARHPWQVA